MMEVDSAETLSDETEIIRYLEKSQNLFRLGNELNSKIDMFRSEIDTLQTQLKSEIQLLAKSNEYLIKKIKIGPKQIDTQTQINHTDFEEETRSPFSPSIIKKNSSDNIIERDILANDYRTADEDEAFEKLKEMMNEYELEEQAELQPIEMCKSRNSSSSLVNCKVQIERLTTDIVDVKLSKEAEKILQLSTKKSELTIEDNEIKRICSLDMNKILKNPTTSTRSTEETEVTESKSAKKKSECNEKEPLGETEKGEKEEEIGDEEEEEEAEEDEKEKESDVFINENIESNFVQENLASDELISNNEIITDDESDTSSDSGTTSEKAKKNVKNKIDKESNSKSSNLIEPGLRLNIKDVDDDVNDDDLPDIDFENGPDIDGSSNNTLVEAETNPGDKNDVNGDDVDDEDKIGRVSKRRSKRLASDTSEEISEKVNSSESDNDEISNKKKTYLKGIFDPNEDDKENIEETLSTKKRKRVRQKNSDSENSNQSSKFKNGLKKIKKELEYSDSMNSNDDNDDEDSDDSESDSDVQSVHSGDESPNKKTRHRLRDLIGDSKLTKETQDAIQAERERKKRIEEKRALETSISESHKEDLFLDVDAESKKFLVKVDAAITRHLKPHQIEGLKFMWDSCFENCEMIEKGEKGTGCILAHCMGLGKTFQLIALIHTIITNKKLTQCKRVLILLPVNVLTNWKKEFNKWTRACKNHISIFYLPNEKGASKDLTRARLHELENWFKVGGVLLMGYTMFARIITGQGVKPKKLQQDFDKYLLDPGPDLVVCDEGHMLKSASTSINKSVSKIATARRIVLTGTPLQNNLIEYHCMVSFVKPNLLGTIKEFKNRFVNPINNGQHRDSTEADVRYMKKRAHILHNLLDGCVQRKDYAVIRNLLPPKKEYVLSIRLSNKQIDLYKAYLSQRGICNLNHLNIKGGLLFSDYQNLFRVWTHPWVLKLKEVQILKAEEKLAEKNFIVDEDEECGEEAANEDNNILNENNNDNDDDDDEIIEIGVKMKKKRSEINGGGINSEVDKKPPERWWTSLISESDELDFNLSGKLVLLDKILKLCAQVGDKLLLFSQSLLSLDLIEKYLEKLTLDKKDRWRKDVDYFRMDGSTEIQKRQNHVDTFNNEDNHRARLFLISTKAGGIGINLVGANRCIIFDASWNPSYDTQSIFRIYRFGQNKDVFVYRFLAQGTMEEKIYQRQVTKQSLSQRVIDEHQIDRHFTSQEIKELYNFEPDIWNGSDEITYDLPDDNLLKSLLVECKQWIFKYHEHDSLLENKLNEGLSEEERKAAWEEYENEKKIQNNYFVHTDNSNLNNLANDDFVNFMNDLREKERMARNDPNNFQENQFLQMQRQNELLRQQDSRLIEQINLMKKLQTINPLENLQRIQQQINWMSQNQIQNQQISNIRAPSKQTSDLNGRTQLIENQSSYLSGILGTPKPAPQQQQNQVKSNQQNVVKMINQHRKQIQQQTFSPQQPVKNTPQNTPN